jgi:hydrogenase nickel incorporation protein HypA/HybF
MLMHETSIAQSLLTQIESLAREQNAKPLSAKISCGELNAVNDEVLSFAFYAIAGGTVCEGMKLTLEHKSLLAKCKSCNENSEITFNSPRCSKCGSDDLEILPDAPLMLEQVEFYTEQ